MNSSSTIRTVELWVDQLVVGEKLCPFAGLPLQTGKVRFTATAADTEDELLQELGAELEWLARHPQTETTLLIHPNVLTDFLTYNQFLEAADQLLRESGMEGTYQVASFHPEYQFAGTEAEDAENYSNRSPYPLLHLLREASVEAAVESFEDIDAVPERNIRHLQQIGADELKRRLSACFQDSSASHPLE